MKNLKVKGFTLIEMVVVIVIIGALSAILVPSIIGHIGDSKLSTANANAKLGYETAAAYCIKSRTNGTPVLGSAFTAIDLKWSSNDRPTYGYNGDADFNTAMKAEMGSTSSSAGILTVTMDYNSYPKEAFWAKTLNDEYVGHYPDSATSKGQYSQEILGT